MLPRRLAPILLVVAAGCGGGATFDYERRAGALCRDFNDAAFVGHIEVERARRLYARLGDGLARLSPPEDARRAHDVMLGFARAGERAFGGSRPADEPRVDVRLTVGDWDDDIPHVKRTLPDCGTTLIGPHPEIQVIR